VFFLHLFLGGAEEGLLQCVARRLAPLAREVTACQRRRLSASASNLHPPQRRPERLFSLLPSRLGRAVELSFAAHAGRIRPVCAQRRRGAGVASGTRAVSTSPINARGRVAFLATVRRGRMSPAFVLLSSAAAISRRCRQGYPHPAAARSPASARRPLPRFNLDCAIAFVGAVDGKAVPGGIFVWKADSSAFSLARARRPHRWNLSLILRASVGLIDAGRSRFLTRLLKCIPHSPRPSQRSKRRSTLAVARLGDPAAVRGQLLSISFSGRRWSSSGVVAFAGIGRWWPQSLFIVVRTAAHGLQSRGRRVCSSACRAARSSRTLTLLQSSSA